MPPGVRLVLESSCEDGSCNRHSTGEPLKEASFGVHCSKPFFGTLDWSPGEPSLRAASRKTSVGPSCERHCRNPFGELASGKHFATTSCSKLFIGTLATVASEAHPNRTASVVSFKSLCGSSFGDRLSKEPSKEPRIKLFFGTLDRSPGELPL